MTILDYISVIVIAALAIYVVTQLFVGWRRSLSMRDEISDKTRNEDSPTASNRVSEHP